MSSSFQHDTAHPYSNLKRFGFSFGHGGAHSSRTIMLDELSKLLSYVPDITATKDVYLNAINDHNCLGKRSVKTRMLTFRHLVDLYSLDSSITIFRALLYFWHRDTSGRSLLALLCAYARDSILRSVAPFILSSSQGTIVNREAVEEYIENRYPSRFSKATMKSTAQNINSSFTKAGHLSGRVKKIRSNALPTPGSISYSLLLGYLSGDRGQSLFQNEYARLLDCSFEKAIELAEEASCKGWIVFKRAGDVIEVLFPNLINDKEMEWLREQN